MGATRTIRRVAAATACLGLLGGCRSPGETPKRRAAAEAPSRFASARSIATSEERPNSAPSAVPKPLAVAQTLISLREHRLDVGPPSVQRDLLSFGAKRLLQASVDKLTFRESEQGQVITEASVGAVRAVAHGPLGSLFAVGASDGALLEPRAKTVKRFPHVPFLPSSRLLPDLERTDHFFVYYPEDAELYYYPFASESGAILPIEASFHLQGCNEPLTQLRDGAVVCRTATGFVRQAPRGSRSDFEYKDLGDDDALIRLLPGMRLDEFFAITRGGDVLHLRLAGGVSLLARFRLPAQPYAAAANTEALAFILVSNPHPDRSRSWSVLVTDFDGHPRFQSELPGAVPDAEEDWLATLVEDKNLAISAFEPLVAVGGPRRVTVWDYAHARERFTR